MPGRSNFVGSLQRVIVALPCQMTTAVPLVETISMELP